MKTIIAGGRDYETADGDFEIIKNMDIDEVVCGGARGADEYGKQWAERLGIPVRMFRAEWKLHGKSAGPIRNRQMAEYADALIAFWDGKSRGTKNMIETARKCGLKVTIIRY